MLYSVSESGGNPETNRTDNRKGEMRMDLKEKVVKCLKEKIGRIVTDTNSGTDVFTYETDTFDYRYTDGLFDAQETEEALVCELADKVGDILDAEYPGTVHYYEDVLAVIGDLTASGFLYFDLPETQVTD